MSTFRIADDDVQDTMKALYAEFCKDLAEAGVTITVMQAHAKKDGNGLPLGPALKHHGWPCAGLVKITTHQQRVAGLADALIIVDGDSWQEWTVGRQKAVLHHELHHILLKRDEEGNVETDDSFRPKLKLREHDHQLGGFDEIAKRYGNDAPEMEAAKAAAKAWEPAW